ncbi:MAG: S41 family peptidase [Tissierellaceae bacterium]|nr:S41 family peptidase [Tissierellaceae bacterium]
MTRRKRRKIIKIALIVFLTLFALERLYNSQDKFQVTALDAADYGIVEIMMTTGEKLDDFDYFYDEFVDNYPFFEVNKRLHNIDWLGNKSKYKRIIRNTKTDAEFLVAMEQILGDLNDGHVNILTGETYKNHYKMTYDMYADLDNPFEPISFYEAFATPYVRFRYMFTGTMDEINSIQLYDDSVVETKKLIYDELAYMKIKDMAGSDTQKNDHIVINDFLREVKDYEKLIIDIRGNNGEIDSYWEYIVELLIDEPISYDYYSFFKDGHRYMYSPYRVEDLNTINQLDEKILDQFPEEVATDLDFYRTYTISLNPSPDNIDFKFNGEVYLLVDRNVFSSAEKFASFAKDTGFATLVGETTGGGRVFEEIPITYFPLSKLAISYSRELSINADGTINMETRTIPHIEVDSTPHEDFTKDKCIQAVIND